MKTYLIALSILLLPFLAHGAEKMSSDEVMPLFQDYAFSQNPNLNPNTTFDIREFPVDKLWQNLKLQIFLVRFLGPDKESSNGGIYLYHNKQISPFACSFGGHGLMSGFVLKHSFYYSYSWGSGIHRSVIGMLKVEGGKLDIRESDGFFHRDLFVEKTSDGQIRVVSGQLNAFNQWTQAAFFGKIEINEPSRLRIIDREGAEIKPEL
ncbi:MAG: hypothetical protein GY757_19910 [bacterium]|nr:hypothetical protein [bacterium]